MFDCNIHLPCGANGLEERLCDEDCMGIEKLLFCFEQHLPFLQDNINAGNFMLFNTSLSINEANTFCLAVRKIFSNARFTILLDIHTPREAERLRLMKEAGIDAVKFHCYIQKIGEPDFQRVLELAKVAADINLPIFLDTSFGTSGMYRYDNLKLAAFLLEEITSVPLVLLHSGGARILEAFLLAEACSNVFLDTSFSLPYYLGSSVERDMAFSYKKIPERVIYGSDYPYVDMNTSFGAFTKFSENWNFSDAAIQGFLSANARKVFGD